MIDESQKGGDIVSDGRGYTYFFKINYPNFRVWRCTYRGGVKFPRCNAPLRRGLAHFHECGKPWTGPRRAGGRGVKAAPIDHRTGPQSSFADRPLRQCRIRTNASPRLATLKQRKKPGVDFFRTHFQDDFTMNGEKAHSHPTNYGVEKRQLTDGQSSSTTNGPSFNLENIVTILIRHLALLKSDSLEI